MDNDKEPKLWVTVLKLIVGALIFIALVGLGLYYTAKYKSYAPDVAAPDNSWGITKDSPIRSNR